MKAIPFQFETEISFFEKAGAAEGKQRRIGGVISLETRDRQGEVVLANGLDCSEFLANGWFNDNHSKDTDAILGYPDPESYRIFERGEKLPDGSTGRARGVWVEGYLLKGDGSERYDRIWKLGKALQKTGRRLGYSVEGGVIRRMGLDRKTIAKARVRNVAITNCPVHADTRLEVLAKSLSVVEQLADDDEKFAESFYRALTAGHVPPGGALGPRTGEGAGQLLIPESLEGHRPRKLSKSDAVSLVQERLPQVSRFTAQKIVGLALLQKQRGLL
jgi:hypothetical protein